MEQPALVTLLRPAPVDRPAPTRHDSLDLFTTLAAGPHRDSPPGAVLRQVVRLWQITAASSVAAARWAGSFPAGRVASRFVPAVQGVGPAVPSSPVQRASCAVPRRDA